MDVLGIFFGDFVITGRAGDDGNFAPDARKVRDEAKSRDSEL